MWSPTRGWCHQDVPNVTGSKEKDNCATKGHCQEIFSFIQEACKLYSKAVFGSLINHLKI